MSDTEDEAPQGPVIPWLIVTFVTVAAAGGLLFFNVQKNAAVLAVEHIRAEYDRQKALSRELTNQNEQLVHQFEALKLERDALAQFKQDAEKRLEEAAQQIADSQKSGSKGKAGAKAKH